MKPLTVQIAHGLRLIRRHGVGLSFLLLWGVTLLSLLPADELPPFPGTDKTHHVLAYAAVIFPVTLAYPRYFFLLAIGLIVYSGGIELIQPFVNRYAEWLDLAANACGVIIGGIAARASHRRSR